MDKVCKKCGEKLEPNSRSNVLCLACLAKARQPVVKVCLCCGREFHTKIRNKKFCTPQCSTEYKNLRKSDRNLYKKCIHCNSLFTTRDSRQIYCSKECRLLHTTGKVPDSVRESVAKKPKPRVSPDMIDTVRAAKEAGMSYGKYVGLQKHKQERLGESK